MRNSISNLNPARPRDLRGACPHIFLPSVVIAHAKRQFDAGIGQPHVCSPRWAWTSETKTVSEGSRRTGRLSPVTQPTSAEAVASDPSPRNVRLSIIILTSASPIFGALPIQFFKSQRPHAETLCRLKQRHDF